MPEVPLHGYDPHAREALHRLGAPGEARDDVARIAQADGDGRTDVARRSGDQDVHEATLSRWKTGNRARS